MKHKSPLLASIAALLVVGLAGCVAGDPAAPIPSSDAPLPEVSIEGYDGVGATLDFAHAAVSLPLDPDYAGSPSFVMMVLHAIAVRTDECMGERGFPAIAGDADWEPYPAEDRMFGLWSVDYASRYGVELAVEGRAPAIKIEHLGDAYNEAYPACREKAKQSLTGPLTILDSQAITGLDVQIRWSAATLVRASAEGMAALADWRMCIEVRGVTVDPDGRPSEQYKAQGREALIGVTVIEAECAASTGAIQRLYDLLARYEAAYTDVMANELQELKEQRDAIRAELENAIAGKRGD